VYLEVQVARAAAAGDRLALAGKADELSFRHAGGDRDAHGMRVQLDRAVGLHLGSLQLERARSACIGFLQGNVDARVVVSSAGAARRACKRRAATEQRREKVAEVLFGESASASGRACLAAPRAAGTGRAPGELEAAAPVRRRVKGLARLPLAPQLVVGRALLGVTQHLIRFLHFLEARFGVRFLADIGVVLTREAPIRSLDLVRGGGALDAQDLVVVPEFHASSNTRPLRAALRF